MPDFSSWGPATALIVAVTIIVVAVGGAVTILDPETLSFTAYLDDLKALALALAGLAGAHAIHAHAQPDAEPGDHDALPHRVTTAPANVQPDQGDAGP